MPAQILETGFDLLLHAASSTISGGLQNPSTPLRGRERVSFHLAGPSRRESLLVHKAARIPGGARDPEEGFSDEKGERENKLAKYVSRLRRSSLITGLCGVGDTDALARMVTSSRFPLREISPPVSTTSLFTIRNIFSGERRRGTAKDPLSSTDRGWKAVRRKSVARNDVSQRVYRWGNVVDGGRGGAISKRASVVSVAGVTIFTTLPLQPTKCNFLRYVCIRREGVEAAGRKPEGDVAKVGGGGGDSRGNSRAKGGPWPTLGQESARVSPRTRRGKESKVIITKVDRIVRFTVAIKFEEFSNTFFQIRRL